ncbi:hypothetical protein H0H87_010489 [Tephrocybe sp. NHM501043]|nr:hypothetical protein H0H87_010489 [Tephrocybe sp. NHM501043]
MSTPPPPPATRSRRTSSVSIIPSPLNPNASLLSTTSSPRSSMSSSPAPSGTPPPTNGNTDTSSSSFVGLGRPRGLTTSAMRPALPSASLGSPLSRVVSESSVPLASLQDGTSATAVSGFSMLGILSPTSKSRAQSRSRSRSGSVTGGNEIQTQGHGQGVLGSPASWWTFGKDAHELALGEDDDDTQVGGKARARPWRDTPKRKKSQVPEEHTEGWLITRERVAQATTSVLGTALDIAHEVLLTSVDLLQFAPVPGLAPAAKVLLQIWDCVQGVDTNRLQCLRLTERCADILLSVREEVKEAGDEVGEELTGPIGKLVESFQAVHTFLLKQSHRPFLKRYLKRDEIQGQIQACDKALGEALGMFGLGIQIRILRTVQEGERRRREDVKALVGMLEDERERREERGRVIGLGLEITPPPAIDMSASTATVRPAPLQPSPSLQPPAVLSPTSSTNSSTPSVVTATPGTTPQVPFPASPPSPLLSPSKSPPQAPSSPPVPAPALMPTPTSPTALRPSQILPTLLTLHMSQNAQDMRRDAADLRALMRSALSTGSDAEMLDVLQIGREEMPEAIKTLQRALERVGEAGAGGNGAPVQVQGKDGAGKENAALGMPVQQERPGKRWSLGRVKSAVGTVSPGKGGRRVSGERERRSTDAGIQAGGVPASTSKESGSGAEAGWGRDTTLDREFIESGIDALRRMSRGAGIPTSSLPSWTITRYEITRDVRIGVGFFSDVYRGSWRGRTVAIKVLAPTTPRELFIREVGVWRALRHPSVLELYGASSASGERPWFFVCAYLRRGSLVEFLKRVERGVEGNVGEGTGGSGSGGRVVFPIWEAGQAQPGHVRRHSRSPGRVGRIPKEEDLFRYMLEIAQGMEYLHANGVLHGDLKAPELMSGLSQLALTAQMDVYAYAISCVEILSMGKMPWPLADDEAVRHFVLRDHKRPNLSHTRFNTPLLQMLLHACWHQDPIYRPSFEEVVKKVTAMRTAFLEEVGNSIGEEPPMPLSSPIMIERNKQEWDWDHERSRPSPDMRPMPLPMTGSTPRGHGTSPDSSATDSTFVTADEDLSISSSEKSRRASQQIGQKEEHHEHHHHMHSHREDLVSSSGPIRMPEPEPALYTPSVPSDLSSSTSSRASSLFSHTPSSRSLEDLGLSLTAPSAHAGEHMGLGSGYESPAPQDDRLRLMRDERRYRLLLNHQFHPSLTLPLWEPGPVKLGAVGYLLKPEGRFVTLFNSFAPEKGAEGAARGLPSLYGYGRVSSGSQRQDKRNAAQRGYDAFVGLLTFKGKSGTLSSQSVTRRYSFPLRAGHKTAHMFTESTMYRYVESLEVPKKWFKANVDAIMQIYGPTHHIQKEDLFLVIGTLDAQDYALFVSHNHPDGQAHFNVFSSPRNGQPWGTFTTDTEVPPELGGPSYDEPRPGHALSASKVAKTGNRRNWDTVLIARLRFKPDALEATSL